MAVVIHGFLATFPFKYPTFPSALFITTPFKFSHLSSVVPCLKHCTSSSISFLNYSTLLIRLSNFDFFCCFLLGIFFNLSFNRIATRLWSESASAPDKRICDRTKSTQQIAEPRQL